MKKIWVVFVLTAILFSACSSFPEKVSSDDAMLLIPVMLDKSNPGTIFGNAKATIEDEHGNVVGSLKLTTSSDYKYIQLQPGKYKITETIFVYSDSGKQEKMDDVEIPFELKPGAITVLDQYMLYYFYTNIHKPNYYFMWGEFDDMTPQIRAMVEDKLSQQEAAATWEIIYPKMKK